MSLEARMRALEYYSQQYVPANAWTIIRLDGNKFSNFTKNKGYEKPFDKCFMDNMATVASYVLEKMGGIYASVHSDEISILFPKDWVLFGRRTEKITSISSGFASSKLTQLTGDLVQFDSRVWFGITDNDVAEYYKWRQHDSHRNALHGFCFYKLIEQGKNTGQATNILQEKHDDWKNEFLFQSGINYNEQEDWKKRGVGIYWIEYLKEGFNPITQEKVLATRRKLKVDYVLPMKEEFLDFLNKVITNQKFEEK